MHRRNFLTLLSGSLFVSPWMLHAEHYVISADPWIVAFDLKSLTGRITPTGDFYVRNHFTIPRGLEADAHLRVEGEVENTRQIIPASLANLKQQRLGAVLECAGNAVNVVGLVSNGLWEGWSLAEVLSLARPTGKAAFLHLFGRDGYSRSVPIDRALNGGMLVTSLNQKSLNTNHGAPWRALFPGWYGMDSVKWLERIVVSADPLPENGKSYVEMLKNPSGQLIRHPLPRMQVKSVITSPADGSVLHRGKITVRGLAWSGEAGISSVEVADSASRRWYPATLNAGGPYEWVLWESSLELMQPGKVEFICRATDEKGNAQPDRPNPARLDHYVNNWYHHVQCVVG